MTLGKGRKEIEGKQTPKHSVKKMLAVGKRKMWNEGRERWSTQVKGLGL